MAAIQSRFEVAVPELPDHIDPANYSKSFGTVWLWENELNTSDSDVVIWIRVVFVFSCRILPVSHDCVHVRVAYLCE